MSEADVWVRVWVFVGSCMYITGTSSGRERTRRRLQHNSMCVSDAFNTVGAASGHLLPLNLKCFLCRFKSDHITMPNRLVVCILNVCVCTACVLHALPAPFKVVPVELTLSV